MKIGYIFPGQGSQVIGMGKDLYEEFEIVRNIFDKINENANIKLEDIIFSENEDNLNETQNTQIAIFTVSMAIVEILKQKGIKPDEVCGLSLGEYSALCTAEGFSLEDGAKIVRARGEYMQNLTPNGNWLMAAILGLDANIVEKICEAICKTGDFVKAVNYNCPGQIVISGEEEGVRKAMVTLKENGARKVIELKTAGPFHTEKLVDAKDALIKKLEEIEIKIPKMTVIKNIDGIKYMDNDNMVEILGNHITSPVKFEDTIETMLNDGIDTFIEVGPGKVLSGFVKKICKGKDVKIFNIENIETLEKTLIELGGN